MMKNTAKVLIVDDDKASANALAEVVKRMGLKAVVITKPVEALNLVKLQTIHAAIVDMLLPKLSGVDLVAEFRKTKFGDNPVVLVSGVFKDKNFAAEALKKTGAVEFLFKPFSPDELVHSLNVAFKDALESQRLNVASLLSRKLSAARERIKAIEHLEPIHGNDFIYVLGLVMTADISGHFNIVNEAGEIFGVNLSKGLITDVDSTESQSAGVLALINKGFLSQSDWDEFQAAGNRKFTLEKLVQEGYVSPHGVTLAKHEQILADLKAICSAEQVKMNFNLVDWGEPLPQHSVPLRELLNLIYESGEEFFGADYLIKFYESVLNAPIRLVSEPVKFDQLVARPMFKSILPVVDVIKKGGTLAEALAKAPGQSETIYRGFHFLVLQREILFTDMERAKNLSATFERYKKIYDDLNGQNADQVFVYFGAGEMANPKVVDKIYEEYAKNNHPDALPADATVDLKDVCKKCFDIIKAAHDVMVNEASRAELIERKKTEGVERQKKASELVNKGLDQLRKGQFDQALETLKESEKLHKSTLQYCIRVWAEIKANKNVTKPWIMDTLKKLDNFSAEDRKSAFYFMAMGLLKREMQDGTAASFFEKALAADNSFVEARRELNSLDSKESAKDKKVDILTGDITEVISQLFRRGG